MQSAGLELDHFHIDFNLCPIENIDYDYGRILEVEDYLESKNIDCGFIATNAFHESDNIWAEADNPVAAGISSAERSDKFFSQYVLAGGNADYLILQRWQPYPIELGDENSPYTQFGIMAAVVNSPYYEYGLGIDNTAKASIDINVYPNPVSDILNIESKSEIFGVSFYTIEGQRINIEKYYSGNTLKFDISNLEKGIYIIVISSEKGVVSKRLLKK